MKKVTLTAIAAVLAVLTLAGCNNNKTTDDTSNSNKPSTSTSSKPTSSSTPSESTSSTTSDSTSDSTSSDDTSSNSTPDGETSRDDTSSSTPGFGQVILPGFGDDTSDSQTSGDDTSTSDGNTSNEDDNNSDKNETPSGGIEISPEDGITVGRAGDYVRAALKTGEWGGMETVTPELFEFVIPDFDASWASDYCFYNTMISANLYKIYVIKPADGCDKQVKDWLDNYLTYCRESAAFYPQQQVQAEAAVVGVTDDGYRFLICNEGGADIAEFMMANV